MLKNEFLIKFIDLIDSEMVEEVLELINADVVGQIVEIGIYHVRVKDVPEDEEIWATVADLLQNGKIELATPIYQIGTHRIPDSDPIWDTWDSANPDGNNWALELINAPEGWDYTTGSSALNIGVIDFGFYADHEDLAMNIGSWTDDINGSSLYIDHGTMVSSIIAAVGDNGIGMTGVMWEANLWLFECSEWSHSLFYNILDAAVSGARVINLSAGINWIDSLGRTPDENNAYDHLLIQYFNVVLDLVLKKISTKPYDVLFIQSAGNDHIDAKWNLGTALAEKYNQNFVVVSAVDQTGQLYKRSNHGPLVTVSAPGVNVFAAIGDNRYNASHSGTSCAAPHVTGLAGLLLSMKSDLSAAQLYQLILDGASERLVIVDGAPQTIRTINIDNSLELLIDAYLKKPAD
jgi:subtilisin family serine protease